MQRCCICNNYIFDSPIPALCDRCRIDFGNPYWGNKSEKKMLLSWTIDTRLHNTSLFALLALLDGLVDEVPHNNLEDYDRRSNQINVTLPTGDIAPGIIREVNSLGDEYIVELIVEVDDMYESLFYIDHRANDYNIISNN